MGDGFATKLNGDGSQVVFSTYLGGRFLDRSWGIAVDSAGNAYVTGEALSDEFPLKNPIKQVLGTRDAFVTKFDSDGALVYSTFYGGGGSEIARGIAVDDEGNAYIAGVTNSGNFPEVNSLPKGETEDFGNAFVAVINAAGDAAVFSSPLGGDKDDEANAIAVDDEGNIYLTGITRSVDFPVASFQENFGGGLGDAFVAKIGEVITPELKLFFAHFGNGQGLTSDTVLTNPSLTKTATGTVDYSDKDGNPLPVGLAAVGDGIVPLATASSVNFSIPPLGDLTIATDGQGPVISGAAVVTSDNPLGGVIRFSIPGIGIAGVGASQTLSAFIIPVRRKAGGINTGVAMHNTESTPVQVSLKLHQTPGQITPAGFDTFQDGEPVATTSIDDFPAGGHVAKFINELFPGTDTDNFGGTLVVEVTDGKVAATALELGTQPGEFTTLPVTALQD